MTVTKRLRLRARRALHQYQAKRLIARANRMLATERLKKRPLPQLSNNAGYDELSNPVFIAVMCVALVVLLIDLGDMWPQVYFMAGGVSV